MISPRIKARIVQSVTEEIISKVERENSARDLSDPQYEVAQIDVRRCVENAIQAVDKHL
jgi:hypothetical protein